MEIHLKGWFPLSRNFCVRKWNRGDVWNATRKRKSWARFNFHVYAWSSIHCLYFIYARKTYVHAYSRKNYGIVEIHPKKCNLNRASLPIYMIPNRMLIIDSVYVLFVNQHLPTSFSFCGNKSKSSGSPYGSSGWITSCWRPGEKKKASTGDCSKDEASLLSQTSCIWLSVYLVYI